MTDAANRFPRALELAHTLVRSRLGAGHRAVDATAGNGHDTLFLASLVGSSGQVLALDVQEDAVRATRARCAALDQVRVMLAGHETMARQFGEQVRAVMFNLGYLPGGEKTVITRPETTLAALGAAVEMLEPGGIVTVVLYTGHEGGREETDAVLGWAQTLDQARFTSIHYRFLNQRHGPPELLAVERRDAAASL